MVTFTDRQSPAQYSVHYAVLNVTVDPFAGCHGPVSARRERVPPLPQMLNTGARVHG
jgi:hypothetical protein